MNVIADTSIWSLFLRRRTGRESRPLTRFKELLERDEIELMGIVKQEIWTEGTRSIPANRRNPFWIQPHTGGRGRPHRRRRILQHLPQARRPGIIHRLPHLRHGQPKRLEHSDDR